MTADDSRLGHLKRKGAWTVQSPLMNATKVPVWPAGRFEADRMLCMYISLVLKGHGGETV